jgi:hypothetical protein
MNKIIIFASCVVSIIFINLGMSTKAQVDNLRDQDVQLQSSNLNMKQKISKKEILTRRKGLPLSVEYGLFMNQVRMLEDYDGTNMDVQLNGEKDVADITTRYEDTEYKGVRGLKIKILVNKFSKETNMGAVLDDIHLLEKNTDFLASEITKDNNDLTIKGEIYGL